MLILVLLLSSWSFPFKFTYEMVFARVPSTGAARILVWGRSSGHASVVHPFEAISGAGVWERYGHSSSQQSWVEPQSEIKIAKKRGNDLWGGFW